MFNEHPIAFPYGCSSRGDYKVGHYNVIMVPTIEYNYNSFQPTYVGYPSQGF